MPPQSQDVNKHYGDTVFLFFIAGGMELSVDPPPPVIISGPLGRYCSIAIVIHTCLSKSEMSFVNLKWLSVPSVCFYHQLLTTSSYHQLLLI